MNTWTLKFAWRDSRGSRRRMLMYISSMVLGVAALVSINSFGDNLKQAIDAEAATLLGADLSFEGRAPFNDVIEALIDSLGGEQSRRTSFSSMAYFPLTGDVRLSTIRGHERGFPFYGEIETDPPEAASEYLTGRNALVDATLLQQFNANVGDSIRIGTVSYRIAGKLVQTPRETAAIMLFSPRIYVPLSEIDRTLLARGSRADYEVYFKFEDGRDADALVEELKTVLRANDIRTDTIKEEQEGWDRSLSNLYRFLSLAGFMALLLGSLGVASSIHVYIRQRIQTIALLRCFGAKTWDTFRVYLMQAIAMGLVGVILGSLVGLGIQALIPIVLADFLPVDVVVSISWGAIWMSSGIGMGVTILFALLPLLTVINVSPLIAFRSELGVDAKTPRNWMWWATIAMIVVGITTFAILQAPRVLVGLSYSAGLFIVFSILWGVAQLMIRILRAHTPKKLPYVWRQGIANLYRPNNQTLVMTLALGLGTFLIATMLLAQHALLQQINLATEGDRPNLVFFDIQPDQVAGVADLLEENGVPVIDNVPIITMRITGINGETIASMRADTTRRLTWAHRREYRSTYRSKLIDSEVLVEGELVESVDIETIGLIPVSVEQDVAQSLRISLGDTVTFDVQGVAIDTRISSVRTVDWQRMQTNFFFVFPKGVLEEAPQFNVVLTRTPDAKVAGRLQASMARAFPNISSIDISLVMSVFDAIFSRIAFVIQFMALFSIVTGLFVLSAAVMISRFQRLEESVLLKTLGASRSTVIKIMLTEYMVLGILAAATGLVLAIGAGWVLAEFLFEVEFVLPMQGLGVLIGLEILITMVVGLINSRGIYERSPLEVLRTEA
ncbi:MAG: FtsX-like permease family protein [Bacteroidetes bacterium]|nr:MAG: FtsX-like permease family protein [Bacteroidota bacterium]